MAEKQLNEVLEIQKKAGISEIEISKNLVALAEIHNERGDFDESEKKLNEALELRIKFYGTNDHQGVYKIREELAALKGRLGDYGVAAEDLEGILIKLLDDFNQDKDLESYQAISGIIFACANNGDYFASIQERFPILNI